MWPAAGSKNPIGHQPPSATALSARGPPPRGRGRRRGRRGGTAGQAGRRGPALELGCQTGRGGVSRETLSGEGGGGRGCLRFGSHVLRPEKGTAHATKRAHSRGWTMRGLRAGFPAQGARLRSRGPRCHREGLGSVHHAPLCSRGLCGDGGLRKVAFTRHRSTPPAGRADLDGASLLGT
nr:uncharacterized protein LOC105478066 [Macaca nemestrina]